MAMLMLRVDKKLPSVSLLHQVYWTSGGKHHVTMLILSVAKNLMLVLTSLTKSVRHQDSGGTVNSMWQCSF